MTVRRKSTPQQVYFLFSPDDRGYSLDVFFFSPSSSHHSHQHSAGDDYFACYSYQPASVVVARHAREAPASVAERVASAIVAGVKRVAAARQAKAADPLPLPPTPRLLPSAADKPHALSPHALRAYLGTARGEDDDCDGVLNAGSTASCTSTAAPPPPAAKRARAAADAACGGGGYSPPTSPTSALLSTRGSGWTGTDPSSGCPSTPRGGMTLGRPSPPPIPAGEWRRTLAAEAAAAATRFQAQQAGRAAAAAHTQWARRHRPLPGGPASAPEMARRARLCGGSGMGGDAEPAAVRDMTRSLDATWFFGGV